MSFDTYQLSAMAVTGVVEIATWACALLVFLHTRGADWGDGSTLDVGLLNCDVIAVTPDGQQHREGGASPDAPPADTTDAYRVLTSSSGGDATTRIRTDPTSSRLIRASSSGGVAEAVATARRCRCRRPPR